MILCDVDGVLADFIGGICRWHGTLRPENFQSFDQPLPPEDQAVFDEAYRSPGFCYGLDWYPGAKDFLKALQRLDKVVCVTAPGPSATWHHERLEWLRPHIDPKNVIFADAQHKPLICGSVLIEDRLETLEAWRKGWKILIDRPWNRHGGHIYRAKTYDNALRMLRNML